MKAFGVALNTNDLRHLVLSNKDEIAVLKKTASFLLSNNKGVQNALFHLSEQEATFQFSERYGREYLQNVWKEEQRNAKYRVEGHWKEVKRKQSLAAKLRIELSNLKIDLAKKENEEYNARDSLCACDFYSSEYNRRELQLREAERKTQKATSLVEAKASELESK